ncbi:MAG: DUF1365 domain-containing protein [Parvibaculum sp.]
MRSCIYKGSVHHTRQRPRRHHLNYRVFSLLVDLDELPELAHGNRFLGVNRPGLFSFWERDHGEGTDVGLKDWALDHLTQANIPTENVSVRLLCYPRILGYVFNPLSVYYCYDGKGALVATLHEVNNTFGEKHTYVLPAVPPANGARAGGRFQQSSPKHLAVSPFTEMNAEYQFNLNEPKDSVHVHICLRDTEGPLLSASFSGTRYRLSDRQLLLTFFQYPLMTLKVTLGIHVEALRLWLKGVPLVPRTPAPQPISASHPIARRSPSAMN